MPRKKRSFEPIGYDKIGKEYTRLYGKSFGQKKAIKWLMRNIKKDSTILDLGSGTGLPTAKLLIEGGFHVIGIDNSNKMIELSQENVPEATFITMNLKKMKFDQKFDSITAFFTLLHIEKSFFSKIIKQIYDLMKINGIFIISMIEGDLDEEALFLGQKMHFTSYPRAELQGILEKNNFTIIRKDIQRFQPKINDADPETQLYFYCRK